MSQPKNPKTEHRMIPADALDYVRSWKFGDFGVATGFGVADITKKEAVRLLETCEAKVVVLSLPLPSDRCPRVILEYVEE